MIRVDESDPVGEIEPSFPYRDVVIKRGVDAKEFYELQSEIGRGKFGTVYRCREKSSGLTLAAKFVPVPRRDDRRNVEREVEIMRMLQHPRLIQLYDAFDSGKNMCVVLELIEGGELFERVIDDDFILTEKSCTVFMRQICEGIEFVHRQNILHLDMKPENILCLTKTGNRIKIIDFGLARKYDPNKKLQVLFGTPEFVAPEVVNFDQIGYGTDMWSVGVICYVLLSGLSPFMGETDIETMANVTIAKYDFDDEAFTEISEEAKDFITKLLVKDREARMTADECLEHRFLKRKKLPPSIPTGLETTKDNLRAFVERWGEHPNSPYLFDLSTHIISPIQPSHLELAASQHSLRGFSPSPCCSLGTSPDSVIDHELIDTSTDDVFPISLDKNNFDYMQNLERRASDSSCVIKKTDSSGKVNLAEEIKKLSDKLSQLAAMSTDLNSDSNFNDVSSSGVSSQESTPTKIFELENFNETGPEKLFTSTKSIQITNTYCAPTIKQHENNSFFEGISSKTVPTCGVERSLYASAGLSEDIKCNFTDVTSKTQETHHKVIQEPIMNGYKPTNTILKSQEEFSNVNSWFNNRRTKFKLTSLNRDVPIAPFTRETYLNEEKSTRKESDGSISSFSSNFSTSSSVSSSQTASNTKDLLLHLLDKWDDTQQDKLPTQNGRHKSASMEWTESDALGQKTISSLNTFFQSRQVMKKSHPFISSNGVK